MRIDIASLSLDVQNFRHRKVKTERDALRLLLSEEKKHKVSELAQDIVDQGGLDPSSLLIVAVDPNAPGRYIALEGNRRVTALKTLMTPDLAGDTPAYALFKRLHPRFLALNIRSVECVVLDRVSAANWIKRKHYTKMGGRGVISWGAVATARSNAADGRYTRWLAALSFLENNGVDADEILERIESKTTTVERVLLSPHVATTLGLIFGRDGSVEPENGDQPAAVELIKTLLEAMAHPKFTEPQVSTSVQQKAFLERFVWLSVKTRIEAEISKEAVRGKLIASESVSASPTNSSKDIYPGLSGTEADEDNSKTASTQGRSKPSRERKYLAEPGLSISNSSLNRFYSELRKLSVEKSPYISASMIRVFLEKATTHFLDEMKVPPLDKRPGASWYDYDVKLRAKVDAALKKIDPQSKNPRLSAARDVANGNQDKLHSLDALNRAIHDHTALPAPSEILTAWSRFHHYFSELFDAIEKQRK